MKNVPPGRQMVDGQETGQRMKEEKNQKKSIEVEKRRPSSYPLVIITIGCGVAVSTTASTDG